MENVCLLELIDVNILQKIQDGFSKYTGMADVKRATGTAHFGRCVPDRFPSISAMQGLRIMQPPLWWGTKY